MITEYRIFKLIRTKNSLFDDGVPASMKYSVEVEVDNESAIDCNPIYFRLFKKKEEAEKFIKEVKEMGPMEGEVFVKENLSMMQCRHFR